MRDKLRQICAQLAYAPPTLFIIWRATRRWTLLWLILLCFEGLLPGVFVYLSRSLIDSLVDAAGGGWSWDKISPAVFTAGVMAGVVVLQNLAHGLNAWVRTAQSELLRDHLTGLIHQKALAVDLAFYESSEYHDQLERARSELSTRPVALLESIGSLFQNAITLAAMGALLVPYGAWLPWVLVISTLPAFWVVLHFNQRYHSWWEQTTSDRRRAQYYDMLLTHSSVAAELRLFGLGTYFQPAYQAIRSRMRTERLKLNRDQGMARFGASVAGVFVSGCAMAWMGWRVIQGGATLGDLGLFYQAFQRGQGLLSTLLENIGQIYASTLFLGNFYDFMELNSKVTDPPLSLKKSQPPLRIGICFDQVNFRYPGSDRLILSDFNLIVPAGQVVAIVGANGAGKSTLLKLLCRFYDPEAGRITLDGTDIRELSLIDLRRLLTVLFQWPVPYQASAAQNIEFGDMSPAQETIDREIAARCAGAHDVIAKLPQGYDTLLGKWFANGVELSIGEWQRLSLARAFYRQAKILILDEPTSALDSWAEADWFDRFHSLAEGRTAIIITHRFPIARRADMIHVMEAGRIVESGKHDDLIALGGLYARSWAAQMSGQSLAVDPPPGQRTDLSASLNGGARTS